ncbi:MAG: hypothetical protein RSF39_10560 [Romboutsia sp.]
MIFKKRVCKSIALALVTVSVATPFLNSVSAMEKGNTISSIITHNVQEINDLDVLIDFAKSNGLSIEQIGALEEIKTMTFNDIQDQGMDEKSLISNAVKWLKNNITKIQKILKQYFGINITTKWLTTALDVIADISGTLDQLTYNLVDLVCDTFSIRCSEDMKWIIARALRLIMPF